MPQITKGKKDHMVISDKVYDRYCIVIPFKCYCGSLLCRKTIADFRSLNKEILRHYIGMDVFPEYIKEKIFIEKLI